MRRFIKGIATIAAVGVPLLAVSPVAAAGATNFSLSGRITGGVRSVAPGDHITFEFTEKNKGSQTAYEDLVLESVASVNVRSISCVLPNGSVFNPDGNFCEPGGVRPGQASSMVVNAVVTNGGPKVTARVCLDNESTGKVGPCLTVSVKNVG